jgi:drug/metabolite transporter (DMT)-like permease
MSARPDLRGLLYLSLPPLLWAGNAVTGRLMVGQVPPMTLNLLRWLLAALILAALAPWVLRAGGPLAAHARRFALLGLLGVGMYNALQYLALVSSTPLNVTLVASSMPVWMLLVGRLGFGAAIGARQLAGAALSISGVLVVLARGEPAALAQLRLVPGDLAMLLAALAWAWYSWLLTKRDEPAALRADWAGFLLAQVAYGLVWSLALAAGEWVWLGGVDIRWSWGVAAALVYIAVGPAVLAYRFWGLGVAIAGPTLASFFANLTPLFAALLQALLLGEAPRAYHGLAFMLIVAGIAVSTPRGRT